MATVLELSKSGNFPKDQVNPLVGGVLRANGGAFYGNEPTVIIGTPLKEASSLPRDPRDAGRSRANTGSMRPAVRPTPWCSAVTGPHASSPSRGVQIPARSLTRQDAARYGNLLAVLATSTNFPRSG